MVFETYTTYDYSFHSNFDYNVTRPPKTHNDIYYHRIREKETIPSNIAMGNINRNDKGEVYHEFIYSPMLPKTSSNSLQNNDNGIKGNTLTNYLMQLFCCW